MTQLKIDWCSHDAAKYAVEHWHYSRSLPTPPVLKLGVWENKKYIGCVLFSRGANKNLGKPYGLKDIEICELTRVALDKHITPVTKIISICIKMLQKKEKGIQLIISFADQNEKHTGTIYQAGNWLYLGESKSTPKYITPDGKVLHQRQVSKTGYKPQYGTMRKVPKQDNCVVIPQLNKHRYAYPLNDIIRKQLLQISKPYPKKHAVEVNEVTL